MLKPIGPDWVSPSLIWGEVALCRDATGSLWFCRWVGEAGGWEPMCKATGDIIAGFRWSQMLAGKELQPIPSLTYDA